MTRRPARRPGLRPAVAGAVVGLVAAVGTAPVAAQAEGTPFRPFSRTAACAPAVELSRSPACRAALAANGRPFGRYDTLRVRAVGGRDRQVVPDGRLCSGNLPQFRGLDLARTDWPSSPAAAGARLAVEYRATVARRGVFRFYLTEQGYDPRRALRWDDLSERPIATVPTPAPAGGRYRMSVPLPADRSGRHVLYTVWQVAGSGDTFYSCSDLQVRAARGDGSAPRVGGDDRPGPPSPSAGAPPVTLNPAPTATAEPPRPQAADPRVRTMRAQTLIAAAIGVTAVLAATGWWSTRRSRARRNPRHVAKS